MEKRRIYMVMGILLLSADVLLASTVSVKGTVKNVAGTGVAGVTVSLANLTTLTATTDAQGAFTLNGSTSVQMLLSAKPRFQFSLINNTLVIAPIFDNIKGCVDIFASNGRKNASILFSGNRAGKQIVNLPEFVSGLNIIRVTIGTETITRTLVCLDNFNRYLKNDIANTAAGGNFALAKSTGAAVDTLIAKKINYQDKKTAITSYNQDNIAITIDTAVLVTCPALTLPAASAITYSNAKHPDPFTFKFMNLPRVTTKAQWECRRQEISAMTQEYLYGHLPPKPDSVWGSVSGGSIKVNCKKGSKSVNFSISASGSGSILVIDFGVGLGGRKLPFPAGSRSCTNLTPASMKSTISSLYGSSDVGTCMAAAWGVGRVIDVLEQNPDGGIDAKKVMTTGCSTNGKVALFAGVFEPRVALCVPVESGCAGTCSWRVSSAYGHGNTNTDCQDVTHLTDGDWLGSVAGPWKGGNPKIDKLPFDQCEVMALRAPGAMMAFDNGKEQYKWLCNRGNTAAAQGCHWIYKALGVSDNFGFTQPDPGHDHCMFPASLDADVQKFYDKFLSGKTETNTHVLNFNSASIETSKWFDFGTGADKWDTTTTLQ